MFVRVTNGYLGAQDKTVYLKLSSLTNIMRALALFSNDNMLSKMVVSLVSSALRGILSDREIHNPEEDVKETVKFNKINLAHNVS